MFTMKKLEKAKKKKIKSIFLSFGQSNQVIFSRIKVITPLEHGQWSRTQSQEAKVFRTAMLDQTVISNSKSVTASLICAEE